jgi:hypothetical protein
MARCKLTAEIASKLEYYWQLGSEILLSDKAICARVGITYNQLRNWLQTDAKVKRENGQIEHISAIRGRARSVTLIGYLQRHHALLLKAENANDLDMSHKILSWLEIKQFPKEFNRRPTEPPEETAHPTGVIELPATVEDAREWEQHPPRPPQS